MDCGAQDNAKPGVNKPVKPGDLHTARDTEADNPVQKILPFL